MKYDDDLSDYDTSSSVDKSSFLKYLSHFI